MHQFRTLGVVGFGLDLVDQGVVLIPVIDGVNKGIADQCGRIGDGFIGAGVGGAAGCVGLLTAAGCQRQRHHQRKNQGKASFHGGSSFSFLFRDSLPRSRFPWKAGTAGAPAVSWENCSENDLLYTFRVFYEIIAQRLCRDQWAISQKFPQNLRAYLFQQATRWPPPRSVSAGHSCAHCSVA